MNALPNEIITPAGRPFDWPAFPAPEPGHPPRQDGWTPEKQQTFLAALAEGHSVTSACNIVRMSKQSAYALRNSARGAGFALGWEAALLRGRDVLADTLMDRALHGVEEWIEVDGKRTIRHRHDNRLAMAMLTRLDRRCEASRSPTTAKADAAQSAARLVAQDFEQYLAIIARDGGPARAGMFLNARAEAASADDLAPIRALARADRWLRTHTDLAEPLDISDLDPARRAEWSAGQWSRAEAAGLVQLAPMPQDARAHDGNGQLGQADAPDAEDEPVWWDDIAQEWRTRFPPSAAFVGMEDGDFGDEGYSRTLDADEEEILERPHRIEIAARWVREAKERDAWFAAQRSESGEEEEEDEVSPANEDKDEDGEATTATEQTPPPHADAAPGGGDSPQPFPSRPYTSSRNATPRSVAVAVI